MQNEPIPDFVWTEQLSVGNAILDADHMKIFELSNNLDYASKAQDYPAVLHAFNRFNACLKQHFLNEELIAYALGIPFNEHQQDHNNILTEINLLRLEVEKNGVGVTLPL